MEERKFRITELGKQVVEAYVKCMVAKSIENADQDKAREFLRGLRNELVDKITTELVKEYVEKGKFEIALRAADLISDESKRKEALEEIDKRNVKENFQTKIKE